MIRTDDILAALDEIGKTEKVHYLSPRTCPYPIRFVLNNEGVFRVDICGMTGNLRVESSFPAIGFGAVENVFGSLAEFLEWFKQFIGHLPMSEAKGLKATREELADGYRERWSAAVRVPAKSLVEIAREASKKPRPPEKRDLLADMIAGLDELKSVVGLSHTGSRGRLRVRLAKFGSERCVTFSTAGDMIYGICLGDDEAFDSPREALEWFAREHAAHFIDEEGK